MKTVMNDTGGKVKIRARQSAARESEDKSAPECSQVNLLKPALMMGAGGNESGRQDMQ